jgi:hypothetical protein
MLGLEPGQNRSVTVKCVHNGKYVSTDPNQQGRLLANQAVASQSNLGPWERYQLYRLDATHYAIRSHGNFKWWCAIQDDARWKHVYANRTNRSTWETFELVDLGAGRCAIQSFTGQYVAAELGGGGEDLNANRPAVHEWEQFEITPLDVTSGYMFSFDHFEIKDTLSPHTDTDHASFALMVGTREIGRSLRSYGDLGNGVNLGGLMFGPVPLTADATSVTLNYHILNSGHGNLGEVNKALNAATDELFRNKNLGSSQGGGKNNGFDWLTIVKEAIKTITNLLLVDCDGPVLADQILTTASSIVALVPNIGDVYISPEKEYTAKGGFRCGPSRYLVSWAVMRV